MFSLRAIRFKAASFLAFLILASAVPVPAAFAALLDDPSLERNIVAIEKRYAHLAEEYDIYERLIREELNSSRLEDLEVQFSEIAFLLRVAVGQPFSYRHLYNEMFDLHRDVSARIALLESVISAAEGNLKLIRESDDEYRQLPRNRLSEKARRAIADLNEQFGRLRDRMQAWLKLLLPYRDRLQALSSRIDSALEALQGEIPEWLGYFMFTTESHLFQVQPWLRLSVSLRAWSDSVGYFVAAKLPDNNRRLLRFLALFGVSAVLVFLSGAWLWRRLARPRLRGRPEAGRNLVLGAVGLVLALLIFVSSTELEFPGRMFFQDLQTLCAAFGMLHLAWGLRGLGERITPASPLRPLFWLFLMVMAMQIVVIPLVLAQLAWIPIACAAVWACLRSRRRTALALEQRLCTASAILYALTGAMCLAGLVFPALLLVQAWFVAALLLQLGVALSRLIRESLAGSYAGTSRFVPSILAGLTLPVLWMLLAVGFVFWLVEQFGEIRLLARFIKIDKAAAVILALLVILFLDRLLASLLAFYGTYQASRKRPIKGYVQLAKLFVYIVGAIVLACLLMEKSPWGILGGIGAMTAVLIFVFKDTIQALVASVQIVADDLVRIGDWIEIPDKNVDGDVIDVTLHTIKVQNWDKTISTVSTYSLISESFKNWRGMYEAEGRRIKRRLLLDQASIRFLDQPLLKKLSTIENLKEFLDREPMPAPPESPEQALADPAVLNQPQATNAGAFRAYMAAWLRNHPLVRSDMTFLLRYLDPTIDGLPFEIYVFASDTHWPTYESIQADILDHAEASLPLFDLHVSQRPAPPRSGAGGEEKTGGNF